MKKITFSVAVALVVSGAALGGYAYHQQSQIDPMILENIEALSTVEIGKGEACYVTVTYDAKLPKVSDCNKGECRYTNGTHGTSTSTCQ